MIFPALVNALQEKTGEIPNVLKRGARYFTISTNEIIFNDCLNYTAPCKLSGYLEQWKVVEKKSIFPYQLFSSVEEMVSCTEFPPVEAFYSSLSKTAVEPEIYNATKSYYNRCKRLPEGHPEKMSNMGDFMAYYNKLDVSPLVEAMNRSFECFHKYFGLDASQYLSLPKIALQAVMKLYDQNCSYIYTFGQSWNTYRQAQRDNVIGGAVAVYHR